MRGSLYLSFSTWMLVPISLLEGAFDAQMFVYAVLPTSVYFYSRAINVNL